jgi:hypothetical protein
MYCAFIIASTHDLLCTTKNSSLYNKYQRKQNNKEKKKKKNSD